ncbi:GerMN domain-containing protein [Desertibacillus haloalkaliphilus]|uniref:GerMN domain-containing protein n=1 Tax=Desertibacillus haloalkaliphilus TaxID=1328930 RepID=UPI001C27A060|nr:GerMN domain-containing protein [Desertibacillus haloalkaliphilus]MBU8905091.1 GerMN domain-containing protein [Desertibacillus haloalkaliphilus]
MRNLFRTGVPVILLLSLSLIVSACNFGADETLNEMDSPPVDYIDEGEPLETDMDGDAPLVEEGEATEDVDENSMTDTVTRELYLLDQDGLVVPQTMELPKEEGAIKQSLEYLVEGGPITNELPSGFRAVIPSGTEVDVHLEDGVAIVDFSPEFEEYLPEDEMKILQAITWTATQFEEVDRVQIRINGYEQETMPVNDTPIGEGFSRANGINLETEGVVDLVNSKGVTLYFLSQQGDNTYYVPVTRRVAKSNDQSTYQTVVSELLNGPSSHSTLLTDIRYGVELIDEPDYQNGVVTLNFNEALLNQSEGEALSEDVLNMLVLSLTEQEGVEQVALHVNGESEILKASGEPLAEPVSRPTRVNTGQF